MRAELAVVVLKRQAAQARDPRTKVKLLRAAVEAAEHADDFPAFQAAIAEYEAACLAWPLAESEPS